MSFTVTPLHPLFAAEISGVDLRRVDDATLAEIIGALNRYAVCVIHHDEPLSDAEHIAFSARFGPIEGRSSPKIFGTGLRVPHGEIIDQSNLDQDGEIYADGDRRLMFKRANRLWHTDMSFYQVRATYSLLSGHVVPPAGADTEFTDLCAVYDALTDDMKSRVEDLMAEHCYWHSRALGGGPEPTAEERRQRPPARHRLVHVHEGSGRKALYLASHIKSIEGMSADDGRALVDELMAFATRSDFVFAHKWRRGDVLIWDNLCTMHRATAFDDQTYKRDMRRTTCRESVI
jgi:alpha-ketoglutarate-dependent 2,4-dichlorophenoxyacetate dioxygenase